MFAQVAPISDQINFDTTKNFEETIESALRKKHIQL